MYYLNTIRVNSFRNFYRLTYWCYDCILGIRISNGIEIQQFFICKKGANLIQTKSGVHEAVDHLGIGI